MATQSQVQPETGIIVEKLEPSIGAYVSGVDLSSPLSPDEISTVRRLVHERGVIAFRNQQGLTDEQQMTWLNQFGEPLPEEMGRRSEYGQIVRLDQDARTRIVGWHSDNSFWPQPIYLSLLRAVVTPACGGDTLYLSATAAFEGLSDRMQHFLEGMSCRHAITTEQHCYEYPYATGVDMKVHDHPVIERDPVTGLKYLNINPFYSRRINELTERESRAVLDCLFAHMQHWDYQVRLRWEPGMVALWHNTMTNHCPTDDYGTTKREVRRYTITAPKSFGGHA